jgi:eukaryotic-like serine/threonine-protein kinase
MPTGECPDCGAKLSNGLCPRCLVKLGLDGAVPADREAGDTLDLPARPGSVLDTIGATIGAVPRVLLRDTAFGEEPSPIVRPTNGDGASTRYRIDGEIARGGMGSILKGRDPDLGRDVAIKVLREDLRENGDLVRRFVEEAQIGGQLQHPGVVPIYELGTFADRRPFFCMKLVKGQTLADLLATRTSPADGLPRFLSIFAAMAQTMAYAHTRGVIHRDLKPSNVMVGSFGEVQVMDWGLAKVLARGGIVNDAKAGKEKPPETMIATARSGSDLEISHAGSVLGTPSYMPPEQARGEIDLIDERADVFALGSILAEILTGAPAFTGRTSGEILRKSAKGDTTDALGRLEGCGAEPDLIALARDGLAVEPEDRPHDANVVSERITAYLAGVQERVQAAERERAVAVARAIEERKRRKVQLALAASVLAITTMGGLGVLYEQRQRSARAATVARVVGEASTFRDLARAEPEDVARWQTALAAVKQAEGVAGGDAEALRLLAALRVEVQAGAEAADRDKTLLDRLVDIRSARGDDLDGSRSEADYAVAFRDAGLDLSALPPAEAGAKIKARPPGVALSLAAALDDWSAVRRGFRKDPTGAARLDEVSRLADPDPWRNDLRAAFALDAKDARKGALQALARTAKFDELRAVSLNLLGKALAEAGDPATAEWVLRRAQVRHGGDVWINYDLARVLKLLKRRDEAIRFFTAARALRPETAHELAHGLVAKGQPDEAIEVFRDLARLRPKMGGHVICLGTELRDRGRSKEAAEAFEQSVAVSREAIRLHPKNAKAHNTLGITLGLQGKHEEAVAEFREAIRLKPNDADANYSLGLALSGQRKLDESVAAYREAIRLKPDFPEAHFNLSVVLTGQRKLDEAVAECREAIRVKPGNALAHASLGKALSLQGKLDESVAAYREAIRLQPDYVLAHSNLGDVLKDLGKLDEAAAECREAIRLQPDYAEAHCNLGSALRRQADYAGSLAMYRKGHELGSKQPGWRYPSARWVAEAERLATLAERLPAVLKGEDRPNDVLERLTLAQMCYDAKHHAAAARFWAEALEADPKLGDDRRAQHRYNAACAASLAAAGLGKDVPLPDDAARAKLREQAMGWLKAELAVWTKLLESGPPQARPFIAQTLNHWKQDNDLAGIRDAETLAKLPEAERKEWQALWTEVEALLIRAQVPRP